MMQSLSFLFGRAETLQYFLLMNFLILWENLLSKLNCTKNLRSVLEVPCSWIGLPLIKCPIFYHYNVLSSYLFSSWRLKDSGTDMANIFVDRFKELGGKIILDDEADKILTEDRTAYGILLKSGQELKAKTIIAAIHPKSMLKILQEGSTKPAYVKRINQIEDTTGMFSVQIGLDADVHKELPYNIFRLKADKDGFLTKGAFFQLRKTKKTDVNLLTIICTDKFENWQKWENSISGERGKDYLEKKEKDAENLIRIASQTFLVLLR